MISTDTHTIDWDFGDGNGATGTLTPTHTRTEYDALSRPVTVTLNYRPGEPAGADVNVQTLTQYDGAGNVTWQRDALGRWTVTDYDVLNRPITVTLNYENGDPLTVDAANESWAMPPAPPASATMRWGGSPVSLRRTPAAWAMATTPAGSAPS